MGYPWAKTLQHVNFGMVQGMSTRKGTAVFLEDILNESKGVMHDVMRKNEAKYAAIDDPEFTSDKLGITAVKVQDFAGKRCVVTSLRGSMSVADLAALQTASTTTSSSGSA